MPSLATTLSALFFLATITSTTAAPASTLCERSTLTTRNDDNNLLCLYLTNGLNWAGEGENLCQIAGQCCK